MNKEEIDDPVVRELDVFVTDVGSLDAFLLQFPLKPEFAGTTLPPEIPVARFKKQFKKLEVEIPFASSSTQRNKPPIKQIFHSATVARSTCLAAGIIHNGAMHITPFQDVLQMRPTFKSKQQPGSWGNNDAEYLSDASEEKEVRVEQIQMKRRETERTQSARTQSYSHIQMLEENDPWIRLETYGMEHEKSKNSLEEALRYKPTEDNEAMDAEEIEIE